MERVDSAEKSLGEVTQQMRGMFYDYQRIFMTQTVLSASSCGTVFLHSDASPRVQQSREISICEGGGVSPHGE